MKYVFVVVCWSSLLSQASLPKLRSMCWRMLAEVNKLEGVSLGWAKFGGVCEALGPQFGTIQRKFGLPPTKKMIVLLNHKTKENGTRAFSNVDLSQCCKHLQT